MKIVVDRIEGQQAVIELDGTCVEIPLALLPEGASEGSRLVLTLDPRGGVSPETAARLERLKQGAPEDQEIDL